MNRRSVAAVLLTLVPGALLVGACGDDSYPRCGAFDFDQPFRPSVTDEHASFEDCGQVQVEGDMAAPSVPDPTPLDCALEHLAEGRAMQLAIHWGPDVEYSETAMIWSDDDGLVMWWRRVTNDLDNERRARTYMLDGETLEGCRALADAGERFLCLYEALDTANRVETCFDEVYGD